MHAIYIRSLADPDATIETVGGKGASLSRLAMAGLPVPDGFHVTTAAYHRFVESSGLRERILAAMAAVDPARPTSMEEASRQIGQSFARSAMPEEVAEEIRQGYAGLGGGTAAVAVRSSATAEDLPEASFAGQLDTYLNVRGESMVLDAVKRCWASLWTVRAIGYRARSGISWQEVSLAVVVQKLVPARVAGVMFTANPMTGARGELTINSAWGLGEAVVGGRVTPDMTVFEKIGMTVIENRIGSKDVMTVCASDGTREEPVPSQRRGRAVLGRAQSARLARIGMQVERLYGQPVDIEWALCRGRFFLLQARPITTLTGHNPDAGEWNDSLSGDFLWTRANYGEAVPDVMTPCTWSLVQILLDNADPSFGPWPYGNIGGRLYKNLSETASLVAAFGVSPRRFSTMIEAGFGRIPKGLDIPVVRLSPLRLLRTALPVVLHDMDRRRARLGKLPAFLVDAPARCETLKARIREVSRPAELATLWQSEVFPFFLECCHTLQAAVNQGGGAILMVPRSLKKLVGEDDASALLTGHGIGSGQLASLGPLLGLAGLAKGEIDRETFARQYGHRGPHEMEVSVPRPAERPDWIDRELEGVRRAGVDARELLRRQEARRVEAMHRLQTGQPRKEASVRRRIERWEMIARDREAVRSEVVRSVWVLRSFVLRAGELSGQGDGAFFLSIEEILALLAGDRSSLVRIPARRAAYGRYRALPSYPTLIRGRFDPFLWAADPARRSDLFDASGGGTPGGRAGGAVSGFPGSAGVVEGTARVVVDFEDGGQLRPGEILVTTMTNVGWTPLFPRAAAVVTDVGAPLSHAAIIARELGIPAVVGCGNATMRLKTGDRVRVDGGKGQVDIVLAAPR